MQPRWLYATLVAACAASGCRQGRTDRAAAHDQPVVHHDRELLPGRVKSAFAREFPGADIQRVEKLTHADGTAHWEVRYRAVTGEMKVAEFDTDGRLLPQ